MLQPSSGPIHRRDAEFTEIGVLDQEIFTLRPQRLRGEYFFSIDTIRIAAGKFTTFVGVLVRRVLIRAARPRDHQPRRARFCNASGLTTRVSLPSI